MATQTQTLPTLTQADVAAHNTSKSCYVTIGTNVYDVTDFIGDHPGGGELILEWAGKDVTEIMKDDISHSHSEAAYEILDESLIGYMATDGVINTAVDSDSPDEVVPLPATSNGNTALKANGIQGDLKERRPVYAATGMSSADDLSKETDPMADYKTHKFLDLNKPLFLQVWNGGFKKDFYLEQIHRPRHYRGGDSAPLFGNFLEPLSKTAWWVVPMCWLPLVAYGTSLSSQGLETTSLIAYWITGVCIWTLVEYGLHRCLFHVDK